jgi:hypothetical protein
MSQDNKSAACSGVETAVAIARKVTFVFVGERPSRRAEQLGATWQNGRLAGKTLREALLAVGIEPTAQVYLNLWDGPEPHAGDEAHEAMSIAILRRYVKADHIVIGMGAIVCRTLIQHGIPHRRLTHPAARGAIRARDIYQAHVRAVLELTTNCARTTKNGRE